MESNKQKKVFQELASAKIKENRNLIISKDNRGNVVLAQQLIIYEEGRETIIFMKGAIEINPNSLYNLRGAIDEAITAIEDEALA